MQYWWKVGVGTILCTVTGCITALELHTKQHGVQDLLAKTIRDSNLVGDETLRHNKRYQRMAQNENSEASPGGKPDYIKVDVNTLNFNKPERCDDLQGSWASLFELADNVMDPRQDPAAPSFHKPDSHDTHHKQYREKREAKKPKNTKKRRKFSKKKMEQKKDESESESKSKPAKSDSDESDESETAPEFSELYMPWNLPPRPTKSRQPKKSEAKRHSSEISTCEDPTEEMYDPPKRYEKEVFFED